MPDFEDVEQWLQLGYDRGWCGPPVCATHDGVPMSEDEYEMGEVCCHLLRLYEDPEVKAVVERDHSPSIWRATNKGWGRRLP